jgi:hypothetical protein
MIGLTLPDTTTVTTPPNILTNKSHHVLKEHANGFYPIPYTMLGFPTSTQLKQLECCGSIGLLDMGKLCSARNSSNILKLSNCFLSLTSSLPPMLNPAVIQALS